MTHEEFKIFLTHGAICAEADGRLRVFTGPFERTKCRQVGEISLFCTDFFLNDPTPWWQPKTSFVLSRREFKNLCFEDEGYLKGQLGGFDWTPPDKDIFTPVFNSIQQDIRAGELGKAVPVVFERANARQGPSLADKKRWLASLADLPGTLFPYGVWETDYLMMGATPEVLFQRRAAAEAIETMALAGTLPKETQESRLRLLEDPKELEEHHFVVNDIKARLEVLGRVSVSAPELLELPTLFHICSRIGLDATAPESIDFEQLIATLHPTPALGVFPRQQGWGKLESYSLGPRRAFGAPFGVYKSDQEYACWVAIRNIQWYEGALWLGAGCGVVRQSELEREWLELDLKRQSVKHMLGMGL